MHSATGFSFANERRRRRRPSLTPMIDVVFLLLVFFMLASRFGAEAVLPLPVAGSGGRWEGPPRLVEVRAAGVTVNGVAMADNAAPAALAALIPAPGDPVILRAEAGVTLERLLALGAALRAAGIANLVLVE